MKRTDTATLAKAMDALARDIQSGDGVANAAIHEAAERLRELERERDEAIRQRNETNRSSKYACYSYYQEKLKSERELNDLRDRLNEILNPPPLKHPHETGGGGMGTLPK
jgi:hypothetical protein